MIKTTFRWVWKAHNGSEHKVEINTYQGKESARQKAISYFPNDQEAKDYIINNEPDVISEADESGFHH